MSFLQSSNRPIIQSKLFFKYVSFFLFTCVSLFSQNLDSFQLMPGNNSFPNLIANNYEARTGLMYYPSTGYFKIDAGYSPDLLRYYSSSSSQYSFGSEFFVQALGLNVKSKRLPIDAAEGYFGFHFSYSNTMKNFRARLRVLHNSSHLVDGHLERSSNYSSSVEYVKDFAELTIMLSEATCPDLNGKSRKAGQPNPINKERPNMNFDIYAGGSYAIVIHPKNIKRFTAHAGVQFSLLQIANSFFGKPLDLIVAYHFNLSSVPSYIGCNHIITGINFGNWNSSALTVYLSYYIGSNVFNQYFSERVNEFSIGFYIN